VRDILILRLVRDTGVGRLGGGAWLTAKTEPYQSRASDAVRTQTFAHKSTQCHHDRGSFPPTGCPLILKGCAVPSVVLAALRSPDTSTRTIALRLACLRVGNP